MLQYVIIAQDGKDEAALERRMSARPDHLAGAKSLKEKGQFILGGATLDENERMNGSVMVLQFENEEAFKEWYAHEPYIHQGVWKVIEIKRFKVANVQ